MTVPVAVAVPVAVPVTVPVTVTATATATATVTVTATVVQPSPEPLFCTAATSYHRSEWLGAVLIVAEHLMVSSLRWRHCR
ncbi:hypothetical protein ADILRU_0279 [Leifsonia rubra CMS 76R]|nr:hypothetical protein ADILRU_0279 [Leifsonia rubra CMS 76R]